MARTTLTPVLMVPQTTASLAALNLTATAAAGVAPGGTGTGNGVQFLNSPGQTWLLVSVGTTVTTPTIATGAVSAAITLSALTASTLTAIGPFFSAMFLAGTQNVGVDFSSITNIKCVAIQLGSIY